MHCLERVSSHFFSFFGHTTIYKVPNIYRQAEYKQRAKIPKYKPSVCVVLVQLAIFRESVVARVATNCSRSSFFNLNIHADGYCQYGPQDNYEITPKQ